VSASAWNPSGSKIACYYDDKLLIYDVLQRSRTLLSLPAAEDGLVRVLTSLEWSPDEKKLMYTVLEDYPDLGSEVFFIRIIDLKGNTLKYKAVINMIKATWQKERVMIVCASDITQDFINVTLWDTTKENSMNFLPLIKGAYRNTAYHSKTDRLAYTVASGYAEDLYIMDCTKATTAKIMSLPFPIRNLQWSKKGALLFSEDLNNIIYEVSKNCTIDKWSLTAQATGYLPANGATENFIYFEAEPFEEPQPLFLKKLVD
jgi:WD40 repeat protein